MASLLEELPDSTTSSAGTVDLVWKVLKVWRVWAGVHACGGQAVSRRPGRCATVGSHMRGEAVSQRDASLAYYKEQKERKRYALRRRFRKPSKPITNQNRKRLHS